MLELHALREHVAGVFEGLERPTPDRAVAVGGSASSLRRARRRRARLRDARALGPDPRQRARGRGGGALRARSRARAGAPGRRAHSRSVNRRAGAATYDREGWSPRGSHPGAARRLRRAPWRPPPPRRPPRQRPGAAARRPTPRRREPAPVPLDSPELYENRELSWLDFADRVLQIAEDESRPAPRAAEVPRHLRRQPGRVLHGPRRGPARPGRREDRLAGTRSPLPLGHHRPRGRARARARRAPLGRVRGRRSALPCASSGIRVVSCEECERAELEAVERALPRPDLPGAHAARRRPGPSLPVHLEPLAVARRPPARPEHRHRDLRAREGAEGGAAALRAHRPGRVRAARERDRPAPRPALPGHGDPLPRRLPGHARRGLHDLRRGRRPAAGRRGRAPPAALRRGGPARGGQPRWSRPCASGCSRGSHVEERQVYDVEGLLDLSDLWQLYGIQGHGELREPSWSPVPLPALGR